MQRLPSYYLDGYALFHLLEGNPKFKGYAIKLALITSKTDLLILHGLLIKRYDKKTADRFYDRFLPFAVGIPDAAYKEVNVIASKRLPAHDLLGWMTARSRNIPFVTADTRFRGKAGVILR